MESSDELAVHIVDDDPAVRNSLAVLVESGRGWPVVGFDSAEAYLSAAKPPPCLLILDVRLPGISGVELLEEIVKRGNTPPVVLITGHTDLDEFDLSWYPSQLTRLCKPFQPTDVLAALESAVDKSNS